MSIKANNTDDNQTEDRKQSLLWDSDTWSIIAFQNLCSTSVTAGGLFKRLGPQAKVNQRGRHIYKGEGRL